MIEIKLHRYDPDGKFSYIYDKKPTYKERAEEARRKRQQELDWLKTQSDGKMPNSCAHSNFREKVASRMRDEERMGHRVKRSDIIREEKRRLEIELKRQDFGKN